MADVTDPLPGDLDVAYTTRAGMRALLAAAKQARQAGVAWYWPRRGRWCCGCLT